MKILHIISSIDKKSGGTSIYLKLLANELVKKINIDIATLKTKDPLEISKKINIFTANYAYLGMQVYSKELKIYLNKVETSLFHGNGLWQYPVHAMAKSAYKRNIPYIISPHGMLEPWALNTGKWKKKIAWTLYQYNDIAKAACIHATAKMEADNIRALGFLNPIAVIPNGIELSEFTSPVSKYLQEKRTLLFLSRIHKKKGIELLIEAWAQLDISLRQSWKVEIAGNGEANYIHTLNQLIESKRLKNEITIIGPQFGSDKIKSYQHADLFVLPTYSENFGIVIVEALACGIPVITTKGTPWEELNTKNAGWWIDIGIEPLVLCLQEALQLNDSERQLMGHNGRKLVEENYSIESVANKMAELYDWILNGSKKPEFVYF